MSTNVGVVLAIMRFIPKIVSHTASRPFLWEGSTTPYLSGSIVRLEALQ